MPIHIRTIQEHELEPWERAGAMAFGGHLAPGWLDISRTYTEFDRAFGAFDRDRIVGTGTTRTAEITVPGGSADLGYVDDVSVLPTHRRRGIMSQLLRAQVDQMHDREETLAALGASESTIYGRFGFGISTTAEFWKIDRRHTAMRSPPEVDGHLEFIGAESALKEWPRLHRRASMGRVGVVGYPVAYWASALADHEAQREGGSQFFHVAYVDANMVSGLCTYRLRGQDVLVVFLLGTDSEIEAELWRYCFGIDLRCEVHAYHRPVDDPLPWRLEDPRRLQRSPHDQLWLRLVDVTAALALRSYDESGGFRIRVRDEFCPWNQGVFELEGSPSGAECRSTQQDPDLELTAADLAAAYLGGVTFSTLARAGRVSEHSLGALEAADRMFRTDRQPWSLEL